MLTYGIFLFLSIFPIIHPKGLAQMPEENMENTKLLPLGTEQGLEETEYPSFDPVSYTHLQNELPIIQSKLYVYRQFLQILEYLLTSGFPYMLQIVMRYLATISIPQGLLTLIVVFRPLLILWGRVVELSLIHI